MEHEYNVRMVLRWLKNTFASQCRHTHCRAVADRNGSVHGFKRVHFHISLMLPVNDYDLFHLIYTLLSHCIQRMDTRKTVFSPSLYQVLGLYTVLLSSWPYSFTFTLFYDTTYVYNNTCLCPLRFGSLWLHRLG